MELTRRRRFNSNERVALDLVADSRCCECGKNLERAWHADHITPYAHGGNTDVINGQALCPSCNEKKGYSMSNEPRPLRWQAAATGDYLGKNARDYLLVAVPGAGKTFWTLWNARELLKVSRIDKILIVVPTSHVKRQWASTAHRLGLNVTSDYRNSDGSWPLDADGVCLTYAQMFEQRSLHRRNVSRCPTLVILDEVHHLQDATGWGEAAREAFDIAAYRILLSGTPWNQAGYIPWVAYGSDGKVKSDFTYSYRDALIDHTCCDVFFPKQGGVVEWDFDGKRFAHDFADTLSDEDSRRRLAAMIAVPESDYVLSTYKQADRELSNIRDTAMSRAGGLIIARDIKHAGKIGDVLAKETGVRPPVVSSEDRESERLIRNFTDSTERWLIAVRMVSEGVDIPRLRVLIYATNIVTRLYFQQAVGRVIRGSEPPALVYLPAHPPLLQYAAEIRDMREEAIRRNLDIPLPPLDEPREPRVSTFIPVRGQAAADGVIHVDGVIAQAELDHADEEIRRVGAISTMEVRTVVAKVLRHHSQVGGTTIEPVTAPAYDSPLQDERKEALRAVINKIVRAYRYRTGADIKAATIDMHRAAGDGVFALRGCTEDQLQTRYTWVQEHYQ